MEKRKIWNTYFLIIGNWRIDPVVLFLITGTLRVIQQIDLSVNCFRLYNGKKIDRQRDVSVSL